MLKKKYRLMVGSLLQQPQVYHTAFFTLRVAKSNLPYNRYGFIVSKKVDKRATVRNKVKRKIRSCIEDMQKKISTGYDMLFFVKKRIIEQPLPLVCKEVEEILKQKKLLI